MFAQIEIASGLEKTVQIRFDLFRAASGKQGDPLLGRVEIVSSGVISTRDGRHRQFGKRMTYELCIDSSDTIELFFEGKDDHHAVDALLHPAQAAAFPCPELRADEVDDGDVEFFQLAGEAEVDVGKVDEDGDVGVEFLDAGDEAAVGAVDSGGMTDHLGDAHVGNVFGADDAVEAGGFHLFAAEAEEGGCGLATAKFGDELRAVVVAAGFAGREKDARIGCRGDGTSVDFLEGIVWHKVRRSDFGR